MARVHLLESAFRVVRCVLLHPDVHDGAHDRVLSGDCRETSMEGFPRYVHALASSPGYSGSAGWRAAFVNAPVVPWRPVPDLQGEDVSALVHATPDHDVLSV